MTKLSSALHAVLLLAAAIALTACGRSDLGPAGSGGGGGGGCSTSPDNCPAGEACDPTTHKCVPAPVGCNSDPDCAAPKPHCRLDTHVCVECTGNSQCPSGEVCASFQCVGFCGGGAACNNGLTCCDPLCVDELTNPTDCGGCGIQCGPYPHATADCANASCGIGACEGGFANCDGIASDGCEIDTLIDPANCGGCGKACGAGESCSGGICVGACGMGLPCPLGLTCCSASCAKTASDPKNCGGCGIFCAPVVNGATACVASACHISACNPGFADCDKQVGDGCEVNTGTDPKNCGTCGNACAAGASCLAGTCQAVNCQMTGCPAGSSCCGTKCVGTSNDLANCGGCGNACPPGANLCQMGGCCFPQPGGGEVCSSIVCPSPLQNCSNQCVDEGNDPKNCGGCGKLCPPGQTCTNGHCGGGGCNGGPTCAGTQQCCASGCSTTSTDVKNCGGCNIVCPVSDSCVMGMCMATCNGGPACSGTQTCCLTGCASTGTDSKNCGGCGDACPPGDNCVGGVCQPTCNGGPACTAPQQCCASGCAITGTDVKNCGGCGIACPAGDICVGGLCKATCNGGPACTGAQKCCATGCVDETTDPKNCGGCNLVCPIGATCVMGGCQAPMLCNGGPACSVTQTCCQSGCADLNSDPAHCGSCTNACAPTAACVGGTCAASEGAFNPIVNPTYLSPGVHNFTTITVPAGVTVYVAGPGTLSGTLDLHASGAIVIDGTIDLSGGPGSQNTITSVSTQAGKAGSGGFTGEPTQTAAYSAACAFIAGKPGQLGFALAGSPGTCNVLSTTVCVGQMDPAALVWTSPPAMFGGGAGVFTGYRAYGSGGGGPAGGAPGMLGAAVMMEKDCSGVSGGGGAVSGAGGLSGNATYKGKAGISGQTQCPGMFGYPPAYVGGGGGGSIGQKAAADLLVLTTFQTGSGGGGGSADYLNRPVFGGTSGGGGGGGALRLSTPATISVTGQLRADGGFGGDANIGNGVNANCDPQPGSAGGGGAGGVIYLSAPSVTVGAGATISAAGGLGGAQSEFATGGGGGDGGLGRIRLSVLPATCVLNGSFTPPLSSGCMPKPATAGLAYLGVYPN